MSLRDLAVGGADCSGGNAITSLSKHVNHDHSVMRDRGEPSHLRGGNVSLERNFEREFFAQQNAHPHPNLDMRQLSDHFEGVSLNDFRQHEPLQGGWADEFAREFHPQLQGPVDFENIYRGVQAPNGWEAEFMMSHPLPGNQTFQDFEKIYQESKSSWADEFQASTPSWAEEFQQSKEGGGDSKEAMAETANRLVQSINDPKFQNTKFMDFMRKLGNREVEIENNKVVEVKAPVGGAWAQEFENGAAEQEFEQAWGNSKAELKPLDWASEFQQSSQDAVPAERALGWVDSEGNQTSWEQEYTIQSKEKEKWAEEFEQNEQQNFERTGGLLDLPGPSKFETFEDWVEAYKKSIAPLHDQEAEEWEAMEKDWNKYNFQGYGYEGYNKEMYSTYLFEQNNPYLGVENPLAEGCAALENNRLSDAILFFEAAVHQDPTNAKAWETLGITQAENEKDVHAIAALQKATSIDPTGRLDSWISLAISYSNELCRVESFNALQSWLQHNPKYSHLVDTSRLGSGDRHAEVVSLFIQAARSANPEQGLDPDVQLALGVLFNVSGEYDKAIDCFTAAAAAKPQDYRNWNRLGAALANAGRSEQAIEAYYRALDIHPGFIRARCNLGISCINLNAFREAAEHFLTALSLQMAGGSGSQTQMSREIWDSLRITFISMGRDDLAEKTSRFNVDDFRGEFDFS